MPRKRTTRGRKKAAVKGLSARRTFGGKVYTKSSCSKTKTAAKQTAQRKRSNGQNARVVKNPAGGYCVYSRKK